MADSGKMNEEARAELDRLRRERSKRVEEMLHTEISRNAVSNSAYWLVVVGGSLLLNLLFLVVIAR